MGVSGRGRRDRVKAGLWGVHVAAWRESGESMAGYCRRHGLLEQSFHYWKKVLSSEGGAVSGALDAGADGACRALGVLGDGVDGEAGSRETCVARRARGSSARTRVSAPFAEVRVVDDVPAAELTVVLAGGRAVRVPRGFDGETLRRVVVALESLSC